MTESSTSEAAESLRAILAAIAAGEVVCHPATRHRMEGALLALEQLAGADVPDPRGRDASRRKRLSNERLGDTGS